MDPIGYATKVSGRLSGAMPAAAPGTARAPRGPLGRSTQRLGGTVNGTVTRRANGGTDVRDACNCPDGGWWILEARSVAVVLVNAAQRGASRARGAAKDGPATAMTPRT